MQTELIDKNHIKLWKFQMKETSGPNFSGKTPLHFACKNFTEDDCNDFWIKLAELDC